MLKIAEVAKNDKELLVVQLDPETQCVDIGLYPRCRRISRKNGEKVPLTFPRALSHFRIPASALAEIVDALKEAQKVARKQLGG